MPPEVPFLGAGGERGGAAGGGRDGVSSSAPVDRYREVYVLFLVLGVGILFPWNAYMSAVDYFTLLYPDLRPSFAFATGYMVPNFLAFGPVLVLGKRLSFRLRVTGSLVLYLVLLASTPLLALQVGGFDLGPSAFWLTLVLVVISGATDAVIQGALYGMSALFPGRYTSAVQTGTGVAGTVVVMLRMATKGAFADTVDGTRDSATVYFLLCATWMAFCLFAFLRLERAPYARFYFAGGTKGAANRRAAAAAAAAAAGAAAAAAVSASAAAAEEGETAAVALDDDSGDGDGEGDLDGGSGGGSGDAHAGDHDRRRRRRDPQRGAPRAGPEADDGAPSVLAARRPAPLPTDPLAPVALEHGSGGVAAAADTILVAGAVGSRRQRESAQQEQLQAVTLDGKEFRRTVSVNTLDVFRRIWGLALLECLQFVISLGVYPSILAQIDSVSWELDRAWLTLILMLIFNVFDGLGKTVPVLFTRGGRVTTGRGGRRRRRSRRQERETEGGGGGGGGRGEAQEEEEEEEEDGDEDDDDGSGEIGQRRRGTELDEDSLREAAAARRLPSVGAFALGTAARALMVPVFVLGARGAIQSDPVMCLTSAFFAFGNGFIACSALVLAPPRVEPHEKEVAGTIMVCALTVGLVSGVFLSNALGALVEEGAGTRLDPNATVASAPPSTQP